MSNSHTPPTRPGSAVSISSTGATVATTVGAGEDHPNAPRYNTLGDALRSHTSWEGPTVYAADEVEVDQCSILLHEDTLAALQAGDTQSTTNKKESTRMPSPISLSLACMPLLEHGHRVRLDVRIDNRIPYGKVALSHYDAILLRVSPDAAVLCKLHQGEDPTIHEMVLCPFSESLYACGNDLDLDYIVPFLLAHPGLLLYKKQILKLTSPKHETILLVEVAKLHLAGLEGDEVRGRTEERSGVLSGRLGRVTPKINVDEDHAIPFNHPYRTNDDDESVVLGDSD